MNGSWPIKMLGDLTVVQSGGTPSKSCKEYWRGTIPWYSSGELNHSKTSAPKELITELGLNESNAKVYPKGSLLVGMYDTAALKMSILDRNAAFNQAIAAVMPEDNLNLDFVLYAINANKKKILSQRRGVRQKNLNLTKIKQITIPFLTLPEQKRIVAILDEAFAGIDAAVANTEKNLANARELFESYLNGVFTRKGDGWVEKSLKDSTTKIGSGATPRGGQAAYKEEGISLIRSLNVYDRYFTERKLAFIDDEQATELSNVVVEKGDVLFNITGASVARCCIAPSKFLPARVNQHVAILRPRKEELATEFLCYLMTSRPYKDHLLGIGDEGGSTRQAITKAQLQSLVVAYPATLAEQADVTARLDVLAEESKRLESLYQQKLTALAELKQSILQKAFAGELSTMSKKETEEAVA